MNLADLVTVAANKGFGGLDASLLPELRAIRREGPARARRPALLALLHLGGEGALDPADLAVLRRLIEIRLPYDRPHTIDGCFNAWLTVRSGDQQEIMRVLGLTRSAPATYGSARRSSLTSATAGPMVRVRGGSQGDGDAWLVGSRGQIVRRFSSEKPETSAGEPLSIEQRTLARLGLTGPPERLDANELWDFISECGAPQVAAEVSIDPVSTGWPNDLHIHGQPLVAWPESDDDVSILRDCYVFRI